ncbi:Aminopeptidase, partial [Caligus rogercresseyi]
AMALTKSWESNYRIPSDTYPLHYDLFLHPDMNGTTFQGRVSILIDVRSPETSSSLQRSSPLSDREEPHSSGLGLRVQANEFWVVKTKAPLSVGKYRLSLEFTGRLDNGIIGFYRSSYVDASGTKRTMVSSKFQPTYARRAFPCFDEPSFKSTYSITLVKPSEESYVALSNMPVDETKPGLPSQGLTEVSFKKSVPMVTYLVVFMGFDTRFRVYGSELQLDKLEYALNVGVILWLTISHTLG